MLYGRSALVVPLVEEHVPFVVRSATTTTTTTTTVVYDCVPRVVGGYVKYAVWTRYRAKKDPGNGFYA